MDAPPVSKLARTDNDSGPGYWCEQCSRSFDRSDHYARHLSSHEGSRPHQCPDCPKAFNRGDSLYRHKQTHSGKTESPRAVRASRACEACIRSKSKCSNEKPCQRCLSRGEQCLPSVREQTSAAPWNPSPQINLTHDTHPSRQMAVDEYPVSASPISADPTHVLQSQDSHISDQPSNDTQSHAFDPRFVGQNAHPPSSIGAISSGDSPIISSGPRNLQKGDLEPNSESLRALMQSNQPTALETEENERGVRNHASFSFYSESSNLSPWLWLPAHTESSSPSPVPMASGWRDRILFMIYNTSRSNIPLHSFPHEKHLNRMIEIFFCCQGVETATWIHSSFSDCECHTELLATVIGAGATSVSIPEVWQMGYSLQECARLSLSASIDEEEETLQRELQRIQANLLWISTGLWSGVKRSREVAVMFSFSPIKMLRRLGGTEPFHRMDDDGTTSSTRWREWVQNESLKRSTIFAVLTDLQCSMAYDKSPNCSLTELSCPLPLAKEMWHARHAAEWREAILLHEISSNHTPPWLAIAQKPSLLAGLPSAYDKDLIALVTMHGFWSQVWACQESKRFFRANEHTTSQAGTTLWISCQHEDLVKRIESARRLFSGHISDSSLLEIVAEFCIMAWNIPTRELEEFVSAAREQRWGTTAIHRLFEQWMTGLELRTAVRHAGRIFQKARKMQRAQLRAFSALAVYQASLTLWAYGVMSLTMNRASFVRSQPEGSYPVVLDGPNNADITSFVMFGKGSPGVSVSPGGTFTPLTDIRAIMTAGCDIYRGNFSPGVKSFPPLLDSLMVVMNGLGDIDTF